MQINRFLKREWREQREYWYKNEAKIIKELEKDEKFASKISIKERLNVVKGIF